MQEIWKNVTIDPYSDYYMVSNLGNIQRIKPCGKHKKSANTLGLLKPKIGTWGYYVINLSLFGETNSFLVHRLVAMAFIDNPQLKEQVNHKDGNKLNNHVDNLEWVTPRENIQHAFKNGLNYHKKPKNLKKVYQFDKNKNLIKIWETAMDVERELNISNASIHQCCKNLRHSAGGFLWSYNSECNPKKLKISKMHTNGVNLYDKNGNLIKHYSSLRQASIETGLGETMILRRCNGTIKSEDHGIWKYEDE